jgi:hypothetical protein
MAVVARLFHAALGGRPDAEGFGYWKAGLEDPGYGLTVRDVAGAFIASAEFQAAYGGRSNRVTTPRLHTAARCCGATPTKPAWSTGRRFPTRSESVRMRCPLFRNCRALELRCGGDPRHRSGDLGIVEAVQHAPVASRAGSRRSAAGMLDGSGLC